MSDFEDVYSRITFDEDFGDAEVAEIKAALELIYSSSLGKGLLDKIGSLKIDKNLDGGNHGIHSTSTLEIDKNEIAQSSFIDKNGKVFQAVFADVILHELIHAIEGKDDNAAPDYTTQGWNYIGETVEREHDIAKELQLEVRQSYEAAIQNTDLTTIGAQQGQSLTLGREVGLVISELRQKDQTDFDLSDRTSPALVIGAYGDDYVKAGRSDDFVYGGIGEDRIIGHTGVDIIYGNDGADVIIGGTGNFASIEAGLSTGVFDKQTSRSDNAADYLVGGGGNDKFFVDAVWGFSSAFTYDAQVGDYKFNQAVRGTYDIIRDFTTGDSVYVSVEKADWMKFDNIDFSGYALRSAGFAYGNSAIYFATNGEFSLSVVYDTYFDEYLQQSITVALFFEAEGKTALFGIEYQRPTFQEGSNSNDTMFGSSESDSIVAGDGDDNVSTGAGSDEVRGGRGSDTLNGGAGSDTYYYAESDGNDLITDASDGYSRDFLVFDDLDFTDLTFTRTGNDLVITVGQTTETITVHDQYSGSGVTSGLEYVQFANGGSIQLDHAATTNWIAGTSLEDSLQGGSGADYIMAGTGADESQGGQGSDVYFYRDGDGDDVISDGASSNADVDELHFVDLLFYEVTLERDGDDLQIIVNDGSVITVKDQFTTPNLGSGIELVRFADGMTYRASEIRKWFPNVFDGTADSESIAGTDVSDLLSGRGGDDELRGLGGNDTLNGGIGNDFLDGGEGSDTYDYASTDGSDEISDEAISVSDIDKLSFSDLNLSDLLIVRSGEDLIITVSSTGQVITVDTQYYNAGQGWGLERLIFADGMSIDLDHMPDTNWLYGSSSDDTINGNWGKDYILAGAGDDVLNGGAGGDIYVYTSGDGSDVINDDVGFEDNVDVLRFTNIYPNELMLIRQGDDLVLEIPFTGETITLVGQMREDPGNWGIDRIEFANGDVWERDDIISGGLSGTDTVTSFGTAGDDDIQGTGGHDVFYGAQGDDTLHGGTGSDTYVYVSGDGSDYIDDQANIEGQRDILILADLEQADVQAERDGLDLKITVLSTGTLSRLESNFMPTITCRDLKRFSSQTARLGTAMTSWQMLGCGALPPPMHWWAPPQTTRLTLEQTMM